MAVTCHHALCAQIAGFPVLRCVVKASQPVAQLAARLCQVFPDGTSSLITRGFLNLTHRHGHGPSVVAPLPVGVACGVTVRLNGVAHTVQRGCRLRLAVSPLYWPMVWPCPKQATVSLYCASSGPSAPCELPAPWCGLPGVLHVPVRDHAAPDAVHADATLLPFEAPILPPPLDGEVLEAESLTRTVTTELSSGGTQVVSVVADDGRNVAVVGTPRGPVRVECAEVEAKHYSIVPGDVSSARVSITHSIEMRYQLSAAAPKAKNTGKATSAPSVQRVVAELLQRERGDPKHVSKVASTAPLEPEEGKFSDDDGGSGYAPDPTWVTLTHTISDMWCDEHAFYVSNRVLGWEGDDRELVLDATDTATIPRNLV